MRRLAPGEKLTTAERARLSDWIAGRGIGSRDETLACTCCRIDLPTIGEQCLMCAYAEGLCCRTK